METIFGLSKQINTEGQYTDAWWINRRGRFGASDAKTIANAGAGLETLIKQKRFESVIPIEKYIEWKNRQKDFKTEQMELGSARETQNVELFFERTGLLIEPCDMILVGDYINLSPDGDIITDGGIIDVEMKNIDSASGWEKYEMVERFKANIPDYFYIVDAAGRKRKCQESELGAIPYYGFRDLDDYYQIQMRLGLRPNVAKCLYLLSCDIVWGDFFKVYEIERDYDIINKIISGLKIGIENKLK